MHCFPMSTASLEHMQKFFSELQTCPLSQAVLSTSLHLAGGEAMHCPAPFLIQSQDPSTHSAFTPTNI